VRSIAGPGTAPGHVVLMRHASDFCSIPAEDEGRSHKRERKRDVRAGPRSRLPQTAADKQNGGSVGTWAVGDAGPPDVS